MSTTPVARRPALITVLVVLVVIAGVLAALAAFVLLTLPQVSVLTGIGQAVVVVPDDARVVVDWKVAAGEASVLDAGRSGRGLEGEEVFPGREGAGTLRIDADVALGQLTIQRQSDSPLGDLPVGDSFDGVEFGLDVAPRG